MFYCKDCGKKKGWPLDDYISSSVGKCELCGAKVLCFDVPSKNLPEPDKGLPGPKVIPPMPDAKPPKKQKKELTPQETLQLLIDLATKYFGSKPVDAPEEDEYVDIESAVNNLQVFVYILLRDHITVGKMNAVVHELFNNEWSVGDFNDDILAAKADSLVKMIFRGENLVHEVEASYTIR